MSAVPAHVVYSRPSAAVQRLMGLFYLADSQPAFEMMGLGNGRRSMKSPPLVLAALVACIIVLGFNYWIASSRSVDLQVFCLYLHGCQSI